MQMFPWLQYKPLVVCLLLHSCLLSGRKLFRLLQARSVNAPRIPAFKLKAHLTRSSGPDQTAIKLFFQVIHSHRGKSSFIAVGVALNLHLLEFVTVS